MEGDAKKYAFDFVDVVTPRPLTAISRGDSWLNSPIDTWGVHVAGHWLLSRKRFSYGVDVFLKFQLGLRFSFGCF